ncbi:SDR family NAD(P)-dependent oxidoreductase [Mycoplasmatota bacterium]|nr:SDR family NAD(P)-dependent oxidoreductase [Mycoplasmatota bacterium]
MKLEGKHIVVTGAASGIGLELTKLCLKEKAIVTGIDLKDKIIPINHENFYALNYDLSDEKQIDQMFIEVLKIHDRIDIFVANAGFAYYERLTQPSFKHIENIFKINTTSAIYSAIKMKELYKDKAFNFVVCSSVMSFWPLPGYSLYSSTKAAIHTFFKGYRHELNKNQKIHLVFPVSTQTNFFNISGQKHKHWLMQTPKHVALSIIKGIKHQKKYIYPSKMFKWTYCLMPWALSFYIKHEIKALEKEYPID